MTHCKEGMGGRIPSVQEREEVFDIIADVEARKHQNNVHKMHPLQDFHERRMCKHSSTPTSLAFGNRSVKFEDHISGRSKISFASAKPRNVLQLQIHSQKITSLSTYYVGRIYRTRDRLPTKTFIKQVVFKERRDNPLFLYKRILFSP